MGTLGIDFGTVGIRGVFRNGDDEIVLRMPDGSHELAAAVSVAGDAIKVGRTALQRAITNPGQSCVAVRDSLASADAAIPEGIDSVESMLEHVFREFFSLMGEPLMAEVERVSISTPPFFPEEAADRLKETVAKVTDAEVTVLPEPVCAASNLLAGLTKTRHALIIDVGASSTSVAICRLRPEKVELLSWVAVKAGGRTVDDAIVKNTLYGFGLGKVEPMFREMLRQGCEQMKRDLGDLSTTSYRLPCPIPGGPPESDLLVLEREGLDLALIPFLAALQACIEAARKIASLAEADRPEYWLTGRMAHMPAVREAIDELVGEEVKKFPPHIALARGAAIASELGADWVGEDALEPMQAVSEATASSLSSSDSQSEPTAEPDDEDLDEGRVAQLPEPASASGDPPPSTLPGAGSSPPSAENITVEVSAPPAEPFRPSMPEPQTVAPQWAPTGGPLHNPENAASVLGLPLVRPVQASDLARLSGPVLLRLLARPEYSGQLRLSAGAREASIHIGQGHGYASAKEFTAFARVLTAQDVSYTYTKEFPEEAFTRERQPLIRVVVEGIRFLSRTFEADDIALALGPRFQMAPKLRMDRERVLKRMGLMSAEQRFIRYSLDGVRGVDRITRNCGIGRNRGLQVLLLLTVCDVLEFIEPQYEEISLADQLDQLMRQNRGRNHFEVLGVHWSVLGDEIDEAYREKKREYAPGGDAFEANPDAVKEIMAQVEAAYAVLRDDVQRPSYRVEAYPDVDYRMVDDLLGQQRRAVELHDEEKAKRVRNSQLEIRQSRQIQGRRAPSISFEEE